MGQYHRVVNLDKKQYLHPHKFGEGFKLLEFGCSSNGTMTGLAILLACSNNRGGGDLYSENPIIGSWAGDRIAIIGDYWEESDQVPTTDAAGIPTWDQMDDKGYTDVSEEVIIAMCDDEYIKDEMLDQYVRGYVSATFPSDKLFSIDEVKAKTEQIAKEKAQ